MQVSDAESQSGAGTLPSLQWGRAGGPEDRPPRSAFRPLRADPLVHHWGLTLQT